MAKKPTHELSQPAFEDLVRRANGGDAGALADLRVFLNENPGVWQTVGDLAAHARLTLVRHIARGDQLTAEAVLRKAEAMEKELAGPAPSPLERLAVQRVAACWLELQYIDMLHPYPQGATVTHAKFALDLKLSAQRRFDSAVKSLALVRKLLPAQVAAEPAAAQAPPNPRRRGGSRRNGENHGLRVFRGDADEPFVPQNRVGGFFDSAGQNGKKKPRRTQPVLTD